MDINLNLISGMDKDQVREVIPKRVALELKTATW